MPERLAVDLPQDPFTDRPRCKKPRTFWLGAQCWRYDQSTSRPRRQTTFLDLPLELRDLIYHDALHDLTATLVHPYDDLPEHGRFKTYHSLRLANKQVGAEIKDVFKKHYESQMVFFFDNPPDLWDVWCQVRRHPRLRKAKFYLRCINDDEEHHAREEDGNWMRLESERLMEHQIGWSSIHDAVMSSMYDHAGISNWNLDRAGFQLVKHAHRSCAQSALCKDYDEIIWPPQTNSLRFRSFLWMSIFKNHKRPWRARVYEIGSFVLEGEMRDINWSRYDMTFGRNSVAYHRREAKPLVPEHLRILRAAGHPDELVDDLLSSEHSSSDSYDSDSSDSDSSEGDDPESDDTDGSSSSSEDDFTPIVPWQDGRSSGMLRNLCTCRACALEHDDSESLSEDDSTEDFSEESDTESNDDDRSNSVTGSSDNSDSTD